ncbi:MAG: ATP synthase F1 subunit gamma [Parcubacteria group bacterium RIFCSPHIGHO2_01_FULL_47_10b]|nr:MAG: ATP synthase F1 subunit gamma [Parcubacteria group bacterium RIFCSPHIGHO2_01_FULL_47_10b]
MAGSKEIKRRIKSVKSTKKITKAMELVAASKMKRAVASTIASRLYAEYSWEVLVSIGKNVEEITHPLFTERGTRNILLILITSNRGLCGAYNSQVIKKTLALLRKKNGNANIDIITVGKKGDVAMRRIGQKIIASFTDLPANISLGDVLPISKLAIQEFTAGNYDTVLVAYTDFVSAMSQVPNIKQVVPVSKTDLKDLISDLSVPTLEVRVPPDAGKETSINYLIEGDKNNLLGSLAEKLVRMQIYQMLLESNASEQSSRMVAMKNASEAAGEMIEDLTLVFNKARQANITQEISEISAGMASVS